MTEILALTVRSIDRTRLASSLWARLDAARGSHYALAESDPLAMLSPQRPTVARAGCVAEA
jgi:hypothetical protein